MHAPYATACKRAARTRGQVLASVHERRAPQALQPRADEHHVLALLLALLRRLRGVWLLGPGACRVGRHRRLSQRRRRVHLLLLLLLLLLALLLRALADGAGARPQAREVARAAGGGVERGGHEEGVAPRGEPRDVGDGEPRRRHLFEAHQQLVTCGHRRGQRVAQAAQQRPGTAVTKSAGSLTWVGDGTHLRLKVREQGVERLGGRARVGDGRVVPQPRACTHTQRRVRGRGRGAAGHGLLPTHTGNASHRCRRGWARPWWGAPARCLRRVEAVRGAHCLRRCGGARTEPGSCSRRPYP